MSNRTFARHFALILTGLIIAAGVASSCKSSEPAKPEVREYSLKGRVESIDLAKKRAVIAHEDIPGYMNAMTMGFQIPDEQTLKSLKSGDQIEARLIFDSRTNLSWLENIRTTPAPPSGEAAP
ncbi:MAG: hypothetical protein RIR86_74 [Acidobacteriota bacterium]